MAVSIALTSSSAGCSPGSLSGSMATAPGADAGEASRDTPYLASSAASALAAAPARGSLPGVLG